MPEKPLDAALLNPAAGTAEDKLALKVSREVIAWLAGAGLLIVLGIAVSFWAFRQIEEAAAVRTHTNDVLNSADTFLHAMKDAETGQRGYVLTGNEAFLNAYLVVRESISGDLERLRQITLARAAQKHLDALAPLVDAKLAELSQVIELHRNHDVTAALALVRSGQGMRLMDSIRTEMSSFIQLEKGILAQREAEFQSSMRQLFAIIVVTSLFALLFALAFAWLIYREALQRLKNLVQFETLHLLEIQEKMNQQLQQANVTLQGSEERLAVTLNSIGDAVIATDAGARVTLLNHLAERLTGWTQAEAAGHPVDEIFHIINQETRQRVTLPVMEALAHGTIQRLTNHSVLIARDGSECAIADSCAPILDRDGRVVGAVLVFRDVTGEYAAQHVLNTQQVELELQNEKLLAAQEEMAITQARYFDLYDLAPVGYITVSETGIILEANLTSATLLGMGMGMELGLAKQEFYRFIFNADKDIYYLCCKQLATTDKPQECELRMLKGDGTPTWMQLSITIAQDNDRPVFRIVMNDINERKQIEAEQKKLDQRLRDQQFYTRSLIESNIDALMTTDPSGIITDVNKQMESLTGCTRDELIGAPFKNFFTDPERAEAGIKRVLSERKVVDYELTARDRDGHKTEVSYNAATFHDRDGKLQGVFAAARDVTQQKLAAQYARSLIEASLDPLVTINAEGKITDVNEASAQATGVPREKLIGTDFSDYFTNPDKAREGYQKVFSEGFVRDYPLAIRRVTGEVIDVLYNASVYKDGKGNVLGVFAAARDVTEHNVLEKVLLDNNIELQSAKAATEKASLAKSTFLSSMSHELRTPLNAILGFAQLLEAGTPPPSDTQAIRLQQIIKAGWYLLELINEILDLAVIESGKLALSREAVSLTEIMHECQIMIEVQAQKRGIQIDFLPFDNTWYAHADRTRLKQVLINLLSNAVKYNREHGSVEVKCTCTPERIRISIKDSGAGLPPKKLLQLFQPFNRLGQEKGVEEGTGIGLVVTKQLVELMGGTIQVESTVGVGSKFVIELIRDVTPHLAAENTLPKELASQAQENATLHSLLYFEDNPANLMLVEQIIEGLPHMRMLSARDGNLGVALARTYLPEVILMDIDQPGIRGIEAMSILRKDPATAHIPVIALSANAMRRVSDTGLEAGFFRYLTKPIKINEFLNALDEALESSARELTNTNL